MAVIPPATGTGSGGSGTLPSSPVVMTPVKWCLFNYWDGPQRIGNYTYNNGASGVGATITNNSNGVLSPYYETWTSPAAGDRVVFFDGYGDASAEPPYPDGIYTITSLGSASTPWVLTRSTDMNTAAAIGRFWTVQITGGSLLGGGYARVINLGDLSEDPDVPWTLANGEMNISIAAQYSAQNGQGAIATGIAAVAMGQNTSATGNEAEAIGTTSIASGKIAQSNGQYSHALGNYSTTLAYDGISHGQYSVAIGQALAYADGMVAESSSDISTQGDAQSSRTILIAETSNATPTAMITASGGGFSFVNSSGAVNYSRCALITITVTAYRTDTKGTASSWTAGPALLVGNGSAYAWATGSAPAFSVVQQNSGASTWAVSVAVSANTLTITVTGEASETIDWTALVQMVETA
jgi:hypothetical protein